MVVVTDEVGWTRIPGVAAFGCQFENAPTARDVNGRGTPEASEKNGLRDIFVQVGGAGGWIATESFGLLSGVFTCGNTPTSQPAQRLRCIERLWRGQPTLAWTGWKRVRRRSIGLLQTGR